MQFFATKTDWNYQLDSAVTKDIEEATKQFFKQNKSFFKLRLFDCEETLRRILKNLAFLADQKLQFTKDFFQDEKKFVEEMIGSKMLDL